MIAACVMAVGTFLPIVHLPILGTISYVARGRGDGVLILVLSIGIAASAIFLSRRLAALLGGAALIVMTITWLKLADGLSHLAPKASHLAKDNPFGGLALALANSVSLDWGWIPLLGGATAVIVLGLAPLAKELDTTGRLSRQDNADEDDPLDAERMVARYIERQGRSSVAVQRGSVDAKPAFGRRTQA